MTTYPLYLVTRDPNVKKLTDFSDKDKIAVPSVKISTQAIMLQMAAAKEFGEKNYTKLDPLTISLSHPDATLAFIGNTAGVNTHFSTSPFYEQEIKVPGAHLITTSYEILGGPATALVLTSSAKFRDTNPKAYKAVYDALSEAIDDHQQGQDRRRQALSRSRPRHQELGQRYRRHDQRQRLRLHAEADKVFATAQFMAKIGSIKQAPAAIGDLFFPENAAQKGD